MKILIVNGSPKGKNSTTLYTSLFLEKRFPEHRFSFLEPGLRIKQFEKDFTQAAEALRDAELIVFSYPVYTFLVPYQLHRFIELMKGAGLDFSGKVATQITTSKHFYDITAHRFIADNCADMALRFIDGLSADMEDILTPRGRSQAEEWFKFTLWQIAQGADSALPAMRRSCLRSADSPEGSFRPRAANKPELAEKAVKEGKKAVIVADLRPEDDSLRAMIERFTAVFPYPCDVINIREFPFQGGCLSCFNCATDGKCVYRDGFDEFLRGTIHKHDAILYAFRVQDHSMGSLFKLYDDRQFCNGHRTVTMGTPFGYLVAGPYSREENLQLLLEARAQVGGNFLAGVATDETNPDAAVDSLSATLTYALEHQYAPPQNFLGVGGMKIFRDLIYEMRGLMRADHRFFKSHGQYDFPQKRWKRSWAMYLIGGLMGSPRLRAKMGPQMTEGMIGPYRKMLKKL